VRVAAGFGLLQNFGLGAVAAGGEVVRSSRETGGFGPNKELAFR